MFECYKSNFQRKNVFTHRVGFPKRDGAKRKTGLVYGLVHDLILRLRQRQSTFHYMFIVWEAAAHFLE